jgi:hypothetical protein
LPAASVARTRNVCVVNDRPVYVLGDEQAAYADPSSEQRKLDPGSFETNWNVARREVVGFAGPAVIVVSGGVVSAGGGGGGGGEGGGGGGGGATASTVHV